MHIHINQNFFTMDYTNIIGEKIKSLRSIKEISIEELAESTGLSTDQITRIEENVDIPSLAPLIKIARALGVRLGTFLDDQDSESGPVVCRRGEADDTISFSNNATDSRQHMHYHSLSRSKTDRHMGMVEITYGKNTYILEEGDTIYYDSIVPHHVHAYEGQATRILAVIYTPI